MVVVVVVAVAVVVVVVVVVVDVGLVPPVGLLAQVLRLLDPGAF